MARKLVLMEQDLERSEEKVELSERYLWFFVCSLTQILFSLCMHCDRSKLLVHCQLIPHSLLSFSKIVELEEELRVVGNNLKSLEVSEEKVYSPFFQFLPYPLLFQGIFPIVFFIDIYKLFVYFILKLKIDAEQQITLL